MSWFILFFLLFTIAFFFIQYEYKKTSVKEIALLSTLSALAGVLRIPFAALPNVQPTTFLVVISGYIFGPSFGFMVGAISTLVSNSFLGHGPWTLWQMLAWGLAGFSAGLMKKWKLLDKSIILAIFLFLWGFIFDYIMNIWHWLFFVHPHNLKTFIAVYLASFYFDLMHGIGNFAFAIIFGKDLIYLLSRFKDKISYKRLEKGE